jgi:hypothetical protein
VAAERPVWGGVGGGWVAGARDARWSGWVNRGGFRELPARRGPASGGGAEGVGRSWEKGRVASASAAGARRRPGIMGGSAPRWSRVRYDRLAAPAAEVLCYTEESAAGWSSLVARRAHNPKVAGSNPAPATRKSPADRRVFLSLKACSQIGPLFQFVFQSKSETRTAPQKGAFRCEPDPGRLARERLSGSKTRRSPKPARPHGPARATIAHARLGGAAGQSYARRTMPAATTVVLLRRLGLLRRVLGLSDVARPEAGAAFAPPASAGRHPLARH